MKLLILFLFLSSTSIWLFSCAQESNYGGVTNNNNNNSGNSCVNNSKWGGISCNSGIVNDINFLNFISDTSTLNIFQKSDGLKINCQPSNSGGILFKANVALNSAFDPNGGNDNLVMKIDNSSLTISVYHSGADTSNCTIGLSPSSQTPCRASGSYAFEGSTGTVNGNTANLTFVSNTTQYGTKEVRLEGTFDANLFQGTIYFTNSVKQGGGSAASGTLGKFKVSTCSVFGS